MIRDNVLLYSTVGLVVALAFILLPTYERFKDAEGHDSDVSVDAPALPEDLIPIDERTGKRVAAGFNPYEYTDFLSGKEGFENKPILPGVPTPTTVDSKTPSGVKVIPSESMPAVKKIDTTVVSDKKVLNRTIPPPKVYEPGPQGIQGEDKYVLKSSLVPCVSGNCGSKVPGGNDGYIPGGNGDMYPTNQDDAIKKPFSVAFTSENEPVGYLNSFNAFMK